MATTRYNSLDALRLFFAFMVVLIHVPMKGGSLLEPIYRLAVPYFYVLSGYFLYHEATAVLRDKLWKTSCKWFQMYVKYFVVLGICSVVLHSALNQSVVWSWSDLKSIFIGNGTTQSLDVVDINGNNYGLYTLWFLLGGGYALFILYLAKKYLANSYIYCIACVLYICSLIGILNGLYIPRWLYLSVPYMALGLFIHEHLNMLSVHYKRRIWIVIYILALVEWILYRCESIKMECSFLTPLIIIHLFVLCINSRGNSVIVERCAEWGRRYSLDIYLYHRLWWCCLVLCLGTKFIWVGAPLCFGSLMLILGMWYHVNKDIKKTINQ